MAQKLKPNRSDNRGGSRIGSGAKEKGNVQYKRNIHPLLVPLMDAYLKTLKATLLILLCVSCGTRTVEVQKRTIKTTTLERNENIELKQNSTLNDILSVKPIDKAKPIIINGISFYNASILFDKSIKNGVEIKGSNNLSYTGGSEVSETKNTESKNHNFLWIGIAFIVALFVIIYLILKKYKVL